MTSTAPTPTSIENDVEAETSPRGRGTWVWWAVGAVAIAVAAVAIFASSGGDADQPEGALYEFEFQTVEGETITLAAFEGEPLVVNYFAAWCAPCRAELPDFESVHQEVGDEVVFVGVSRDTETGAWLSLVEETGISYTTIYEGNVTGSFETLNALGMPTTVFIGADGEVKQVWTGPLDDTKLHELIDQHFT